MLQLKLEETTNIPNSWTTKYASIRKSNALGTKILVIFGGNTYT